jgi:hypothetical protein
LGCRLIQIPDGDFGARRHETFDNGKTDAAAATGHDGIAAAEVNLVHRSSSDHRKRFRFPEYWWNLQA